MGKKGPKLPNEIEGSKSIFDPQTGLPYKLMHSHKEAIKRALEIKDRQNAVNRYVWDGLPMNITSQELERMIYNKGQLCFFYFKNLDNFYFMPYALQGTLDFYGRFNDIHPVPMAAGMEKDSANYSDKARENIEAQRALLSRITLKVLYDIPEEAIEEMHKGDVCVLLHDYTKGISENIIPRRMLQRELIDIEADCIPYMRTALKNSTGIEGIKVDSQDEAKNVEAANSSLDSAALHGDRYIPIIGTIEFQELTGQVPSKAQDFMQAMQSLDNYRLSLYGLANGGVFEKKAHMLGSEQEMNETQNNDVLDDGLKIRQHFCDVANAVWGLHITVAVNPDAKPEQMEEEPMNNEEGGIDENE